MHAQIRLSEANLSSFPPPRLPGASSDRRHPWRALLLAIFAGCATAQVAVDPDVERAFYAEAVEGLQGRGTPVDPAQLDYLRFRRAAHLALAEDQLAGTSVLLETLKAAPDPATTNRALDHLLAANFADAEAHLEKARALHFDKGSKAALHEAVAMGILRSILSSGEGSARRPWRVFSRREEDSVVTFLELRVGARTSQATGGRTIAALACRDRRDAEKTVHFELVPLPEPRSRR